MNLTVDFDLAEILPTDEEVLLDQGMTDPASASMRVQVLLGEAMEEFGQAARPTGIISELTVGEFRPIFEGEGRNAEDVLLERIYPHGDNLALFALTMGERVSRRIEDLFEENEFATGSMLDSVASLAADAASGVFEARFFDDLSARGLISPDHFVLGYSPGYCGWHITGQRKVFEYLEPGQIGITLNESCLMTPLKSITGLLVSARRDVHIFEPTFGYCTSCSHHSCLERLEKLTSRNPTGV